MCQVLLYRITWRSVKILWQYFNSHAHVERDPTYAENYVNLANFNSHAHVERDFHVLKGLTER